MLKCIFLQSHCKKNELYKNCAAKAFILVKSPRQCGLPFYWHNKQLQIITVEKNCNYF